MTAEKTKAQGRKIKKLETLLTFIERGTKKLTTEASQAKQSSRITKQNSGLALNSKNNIGKKVINP